MTSQRYLLSSSVLSFGSLEASLPCASSPDAPALETEAMNVVRLWRYKPYSREGEAVDVTTDIQVDFDPAKPGGVVTHPNH